MDDYKWYLENSLDEYEGRWVAIKNQKVIAANQNPDMLMEEIAKKGFKINEATLASIPKKDVGLVY